MSTLDLDAMSPIAQVDLGALRRNVQRLRSLIHGDAQMLVAVKADAYGHGLIPVARTLSEEGVSWLGVATPGEALALREARLTSRILIFGPLCGPAVQAVLAAGVDVTVCTAEDVAAVAAAQAQTNVDARVHLKVNTGMARLGLKPEAALQVARTIADTPGLVLEGVWTHFARADEPHAPSRNQQVKVFDAFLAELDAAGIHATLRHAANSAALLTMPEAHYDLVRPGIAVYGYAPSHELSAAASDLEPVMTVTAPVVFVQQVEAGESVSYGHRWTARSATSLATVRFGYADGYPRALTNLGDVGVEGGLARVVGTVCMDQLLIDVGNQDVRVGDRVTVFGKGALGADQLSARWGSIAYEVLTSMTQRVTRHYSED